MQNHEKWRYTGDIDEIYWRYRAREMMQNHEKWRYTGDIEQGK